MQWFSRFQRYVLVIGLVATCAPSAHAANDWMNLATISATISNTAGRLCVGGGRTDLGCPSYAPALTSAGNISITGHVSITGNISANVFSGDGSGLTNLNAGNVTGLSFDRIISNSANIVVGNGGTISFTTGGTSGTAYIDTIGRFIGPGISATTNRTSVTTLLTTSWTAINMTTAASTPLEVNGTISSTLISSEGGSFGGLIVTGNSSLADISATGNVSVTGNVSANRFIGDGSLLTGIAPATLSWYSLTNVPVQVQAVSNGSPLSLSGLTLTGPLSSTDIISAATISSTFLYANQASFTALFVGGQTITAASTPDRIISSSANVVAGNGGTISFTTGGVSGTAYLDTTGRLVAPGISTTTNQASFTTIFASTNIGIATTAPSATLHVSGTAKLAGTGAESCSNADEYGTLRRNPTTGRLQICRQ